MNYKILTIWIFVALILLVALLFVFPTPFVIWLSIIGLPVLIIVQAVIVLRAKDESQHTFTDDKWYDDQD